MRNINTFCHSLGVNDFYFNRGINLYQAIINIPSLKKFDDVSVVIHNHNFSYKHLCLEGKLVIITTLKPKNSILVKVSMNSEKEILL